MGVVRLLSELDKVTNKKKWYDHLKNGSFLRSIWFDEENSAEATEYELIIQYWAQLTNKKCFILFQNYWGETKYI